MHMIKVKALKKVYDLNRKNQYGAIKNISISFPDTGFVGVTGPSGCGKTTFLNMLSMLDVPTSGDIYYYNLNLSNLKEKEKEQFRHYSIGFVYQEYNLVDHLNVYDNVRLAFDIGSSVTKEEEEGLIDDALEQMGILHLKKRFPNTMSGGEKQRVAIARAIVNNPQIILADEPTGALDKKTSVEVMEFLKEQSKTRLVLMVTHNDKLAEQYCDRIVQMDDGCVVSDSCPITEEYPVQAKEPKTHKRTGSIFRLAAKRVIHRKSHYAFLFAINTLSVVAATVATAVLFGSNHFSKSVEQDTLNAYPVTISSVYMGMNDSFMVSSAPLFPDDGNVHRIDGDATTVGVNSITTNYIDYLKEEFAKANIPEDCLTLRKGLSPTILMQGKDDMDIKVFEANDVSTFTGFDSFLKDSGNYFRPLYGGKEQIHDSFERVWGKLPEKPDELIVILDRYDAFPNYMLDQLGFSESKIKYADFAKKTFKFVNHDEYYGDPIYTGVEVTDNFIKSNEDLESEGKQADGMQALLLDALTYYQAGGEENIQLMNEKLALVSEYFEERTEELAYFRKSSSVRSLWLDDSVGKEMHIVGIFRPRKEQFWPYLNPGIYYSKAYSDLFLEENRDSAFAHEYAKHMSFSYEEGSISVPEVYEILKNADKIQNSGVADISNTYEYILNRKSYGVDENYYQIEIMAKDFKMKARALKILDRWNREHSEIEQVTYVDVGGAITNLVDKYVGLLLVVLIVIILVVVAFSILVTSLLSIIEVKGRIREIGLYRCLGATRRYVEGLFIAEQGMLGLASGITGLGLSFAFIPIINKVIEKTVTVCYIARFSFLTWWSALIIPIVAVLIGVISAIVPAYRTTKLNPSNALRSIN